MRTICCCLHFGLLLLIVRLFISYRTKCSVYSFEVCQDWCNLDENCNLSLKIIKNENVQASRFYCHCDAVVCQ